MQQFWIWAGANIAPINWILGALGIILGLSVVETLLVLVVGNLVGCAFFGLFCVMGHRTGVNQMVLSRAAFGRRGAYLPAAAQLVMTMGWLGVNTWVVLDLVLGIFKHMGYNHPGMGTKYAVGIGIMAVQVVIAIVGFYLIQSFEKYTVPVAAVIVIVMSILAWTKVNVVWGHSTAHGADKLTAVTQLMTAIGVGLGHHLAHLVVGLHALHQAERQRQEGVLDDGVGDLHPDRVARLPRRDDRKRRRVEGSGRLRDRGVRRVLDSGPVPRHARAGGDEHPQPLLRDAGGALARPEARALEGQRRRVDRRHAVS